MSSMRANFKIVPAFLSEGLILTGHVARSEPTCVLFVPGSGSRRRLLHDIFVCSPRQSTTFRTKIAIRVHSIMGRVTVHVCDQLSPFFPAPTSVWCVKFEFSDFLSHSLSHSSDSLTLIVKCQTQLFKCSDKCSLSFFPSVFIGLLPSKWISMLISGTDDTFKTGPNWQVCNRKMKFTHMFDIVRHRKKEPESQKKLYMHQMSSFDVEWNGRRTELGKMAAKRPILSQTRHN